MVLVMMRWHGVFVTEKNEDKSFNSTNTVLTFSTGSTKSFKSSTLGKVILV